MEADVSDEAWAECPQNHRPKVARRSPGGYRSPWWHVICPACEWVGASGSRDVALDIAYEHVADAFGGVS